MTIEPTRVYSPGQSYESSTPPIYDTYNTRYIPPPDPGFNSPPPNSIRSRLYSPPANVRVNVPKGVPNFLGNRAIIFNTWIVAIIYVSYDEWHNLGIFPRPARLWRVTETYALLYLFSLIDALVPLANAFAIGYTIVLMYQYYSGGITPDGSNATSGQQPAAGPGPTPHGVAGAEVVSNLSPGTNSTSVGAGIVTATVTGT